MTDFTTEKTNEIVVNIMEVQNMLIYHRVMRHEDFEAAATALFMLLQQTQLNNPNKPRVLCLDIDEHRNECGDFDRDMFELQKDFCLGFLMKFFTEMHLPLISVKNDKPQCNDIPDELEIFEDIEDEGYSLQKLTIENYENTEFIYEKDVYAYLLKFSSFIKKYNKWGSYKLSDYASSYDPLNVFALWHRHAKDLISEVFSIFVSGNFLSARSVTRTLIEAYIYIKILKKEKSTKLLSEWYIWSALNKLKENTPEIKDKYKCLLESHCNLCGKDFDAVWEFYSKPRGMNVWLNDVIKKTKISTRILCEYINEPDVYKDYQSTSSFVHGQDIMAKMTPFTFYDSICTAFYVMMSYIFKTICLFPIHEKNLEQLEELKKELDVLYKKYCK